jgi:hypothetical protein
MTNENEYCMNSILLIYSKDVTIDLPPDTFNIICRFLSNHGDILSLVLSSRQVANLYSSSFFTREVCRFLLEKNMNVLNDPCAYCYLQQNIEKRHY